MYVEESEERWDAPAPVERLLLCALGFGVWGFVSLSVSVSPSHTRTHTHMLVEGVDADLVLGTVDAEVANRGCRAHHLHQGPEFRVHPTVRNPR